MNTTNSLTFNQKLFVPLKKRSSVRKLPNQSVCQVNLIKLFSVSLFRSHKCIKLIRNKSTLDVFHFYWQDKEPEILSILQVIQKKEVEYIEEIELSSQIKLV